MGAAQRIGIWLAALRRRLGSSSLPAEVSPGIPRIGLALGGGFARGVAHAGLLKVFEEHHIPIHCIAGVSAGAIVAASWASGVTPEEVGRIGCGMRFTDVAGWNLSLMGFMRSERMNRFLARALRVRRFEEMRVPLGVVATDLCTGEAVSFRGEGDVYPAIRASCSYPGLFEPVRHQGRLLVDGAMSTEVPAALCRTMGANYVISVHLPANRAGSEPANMFQVVNRCFQIMSTRSEQSWRAVSDLVIAPDVRGVPWDGFASGAQLLAAGEAAAREAMPQIAARLGRIAPPLPAPAALVAKCTVS